MTNLDLTRSGAGIIDGCRQIVAERECAKINGRKVDLYTASAIVTVYDAAKANGFDADAFLKLNVGEMANVAFRVIG